MPVARQSIPRFDLYAALGVDPSADAESVESAYQDFVGRRGSSAGAPGQRQFLRARLAREWLTDSELRSRYDTSRARAAARAAEKAAGVTSEPADAENESAWADDLPWLKADLDDQADDVDRRAGVDRAAGVDRPAGVDRAAGVEPSPPTITWSTTPPAPPEPRARRSRRRPVSVLGLGALVVAAAVAIYLVFQVLGSNDTASRATPSPPPAQTAAVQTPSPVPPTIEPTIEPTLPPPTQGVDTAALQQSAFNTLQALITAAEAGDVTTAQTYLGDTAPGLRASGLRRAIFPVMTAEQVSVAPDGSGYTATLSDGTTMRSIDGVSWTLDYGDRPLAAYRSANNPEHDLWWTGSKGVKHHIFMRLPLATVSKTGVLATVKWSFDPSLPNDATYFAGAEFKISALTFDGVDIAITPETNAMAGVTTHAGRALFFGPASVPDEMAVTISVTPDGNEDRAVETIFVLDVR